jgi:isopentenyl-diphosphate delta-isomerase type 1
MAREEIVSNASEQLILVDDYDREIGYKGKADCHTGKGVLHRAFSIFVFNGDNELLLQQRSPTKMLWPGYWSNTCCSHPRRGRSHGGCRHAPIGQELGFTCPLDISTSSNIRRSSARSAPSTSCARCTSVVTRAGRRERHGNRRLAVRRRRGARA